MEGFMNLKRFEYLNKDVPFLKKDVAFRLGFTVIFFALFVWQFVKLIMQIGKELNTAMIVTSIAVLLTSLLFSSLSILYALKSMRILSVVRKNGKCVSSVEILFNTNKNGFMKLYAVITEILALVCGLVLLCSFVYSALEVAYLSSISYYMPVLAIVCMCGFNSVYHINNEIAVVKNVQAFNSIY